jgi:hypothetical protein
MRRAISLKERRLWEQTDHLKNSPLKDLSVAAFNH